MELHQDRAETSFKPGGSIEKIAYGRSAVFEPHPVGPVAIELKRVNKTRRGLGFPSIECRGRRQMVKSVVDLDGVEVLSIVKKPFLLGKILQIKIFFQWL